MNVYEKLSGTVSLMRRYQNADWKTFEVLGHGVEQNARNLPSISSADCSEEALNVTTAANPFHKEGLSNIFYVDLEGDIVRKAMEFTFHSYNCESLTDSIRNNEKVKEKGWRESLMVRVGILLVHVHLDPILSLSSGIFHHLNSSRVEVYCFLLAHTHSDIIEPRSRQYFSAFQQVISLKGLDTEDAVAKIQSMQIDILIDLNGYSSSAGINLLSHRPSPLQVAFLGDPLSSGMTAAVDYFICDSISCPADVSPSHFTEALVLLPQCYLPSNLAASHPLPTLTDSMKPLPRKPIELSVGDLTGSFAESVMRHQSASPSQQVFLGAFHGHSKISPSVFHVWANILRRGGPSTHLALKGCKSLNSTTSSCHRLLLNGMLHGIYPERIGFLPIISYEEHIQQKSLLDIYLETFPIKSGHATTHDAAWAGLPSIVLGMGSRMPVRSGESIYATLEGQELQGPADTDLLGVVYSVKEYEDLAVELTSTVQGRLRMKIWKTHCERMRANTKLFNTSQFAVSFQGILQALQDLERLEGRKINLVYGN